MSKSKQQKKKQDRSLCSGCWRTTCISRAKAWRHREKASGKRNQLTIGRNRRRRGQIISTRGGALELVCLENSVLDNPKRHGSAPTSNFYAPRSRHLLCLVYRIWLVQIHRRKLSGDQIDVADDDTAERSPLTFYQQVLAIRHRIKLLFSHWRALE